jgi:hypothetical protein
MDKERENIQDYSYYESLKTQMENYLNSLKEKVNQKF